MEGVITFAQLGWIIIFIIIVGVGVFAAMALKNLIQLMQQINGILEKNTDSLNRIVPNVSQISEDAVVITKDVRHTVGETSQALDVITHSTTETVRKFSQTADHVSTYAAIAGEIAKIAIEMMSDKKK